MSSPRAVPLLLVVFGASLAAQSGPPAPAANAYGEEALVIERRVTRVSYDQDGTGVRDEEIRMRVQSAAGVQQVGTVVLPYMRDTTTVEVKYVRVRKPSGTVLETPLASALDLPADITRAAPTFTDLYLKNINVQGLQPGDALEYAFRTTTRSLIAGKFWTDEQFVDDVILLDGELEVSMPASIAPVVKSVSAPPVVTIEAGRRTYRWRYDNLTRLTGDEAAIRAYASRDQRADVQITTFRDWAELGETIRTLWRDRTAVTPAIREKALALTRTLTTDDEKVRALYQFVSTSIRYVGVSMGIGRIQPHSAGEVLTNGFGDCKDKHVLLVALLDAVGIGAEGALAGPGLPIDPDVPSLSQFNHVITALPGAGGRTWLDTTLEVAPFGFLIAEERDAHVLLLSRTAAPALVKTPAEPLRPNLWRTHTDGTLSEQGTLSATVHETISGDLEVGLRSVFRTVPQAQWPELLKLAGLASRFGGTVTNVAVTPPEDTTDSFEVKYQYTVESYSEWTDKRIYPPVPFAVMELAKPVIPVELGPVGRTIATSRLELPVGFEPSLAPGTQPEVIVDREFARYVARVSLTGRVLETEREVTIKRKELEVNQFEAYRSYYRAIADVPGHVVLRVLAPWAWTDTPTIDWYTGASAAAVKTLWTATTIARRRDFQEALAITRELLATEPGNPAAWLQLAWISIDSGDLDGGFDTLRRRADGDPSAAELKYFATRLERERADEEAVAVWRQGQRLFPKDGEFSQYLAETLIRLTRYDEAIPAVRAVEAQQRESARWHWNLGQAQLGAGRSDLAVAALARTADLDPSPATLNKVAWELAENRVGLDKALALARRAVHDTEAVAGRLTLGALQDADLLVMARLAAYWDTLGWAHLRRGELDAAEQYLRAAWDLSHSPAHTAHLAELYEAKNDVETARLFFIRAAALSPLSLFGSSRLAELLPDASTRSAQLNSARASMLKMWTVAVPRPAGSTGQADVFVLIGLDGRVEDVRFMVGDASVRPTVETLRSVTVSSPLPGPGPVRLVRRGKLQCVSGETACELVLQSIADTTTVDAK